MFFCPKCGSLLKTRAEGSKKILACACGYVQKAEGTSITDRKEERNDDIVIVDEQKEQTLPLTDAECPKCKHTKAYYWMIQTRAGDEPETKFLKCESCNHTWRDYD